jgi:hypothetical protein
MLKDTEPSIPFKNIKLIEVHAPTKNNGSHENPLRVSINHQPVSLSLGGAGRAKGSPVPKPGDENSSVELDNIDGKPQFHSAFHDTYFQDSKS